MEEDLFRKGVPFEVVKTLTGNQVKELMVKSKRIKL